MVGGEMMVYKTDDPVADYDRYSAEEESELGKLPVCSACDEPIFEEDLFVLNISVKGAHIRLLVCPHCMDNSRENREAYMEKIGGF
jgi:hypothetical protein